MRIERRDINNGVTFALIGTLEGSAARHLMRVLRGPIADGSKVTVNLRSLESCDAEGLQALGALLTRARATSGIMVLTSPTEHVREILSTTTELREALEATDDHPINARYAP